MTNTIKEQFTADMQVAGLAAGSQKRYLSCVNAFLRETWLSPDTATEHDIQQFFIALRARDVAGETYRGYRFALSFLFENTLQRNWSFFKKKSRHPRSVVSP